MKKSMKMLMAVMALCFVLSFGIKAEAAAPKAASYSVSGSSVASSQGTVKWYVSVYASSRNVYANAGDYSTKLTFRILNGKGKIVRQKTGAYVSFSSLPNNNAYRIYAKAPGGKWSKPIGFVFTKIGYKEIWKSNGRKVLKIKLKKIKGIKKYTIRYCKGSGGYKASDFKKHYKTVKAKKRTVTISKIGGKRPRTGDDFYSIAVFPKLAGCSKCINYFTIGF